MGRFWSGENYLEVKRDSIIHPMWMGSQEGQGHATLILLSPEWYTFQKGLGGCKETYSEHGTEEDGGLDWCKWRWRDE